MSVKDKNGVKPEDTFIASGVAAQLALIMAFSAAPARRPGIVGSAEKDCAEAAEDSISRNAVGDGAVTGALEKAEEVLGHNCAGG